MLYYFWYLDTGLGSYTKDFMLGIEIIKYLRNKNISNLNTGFSKNYVNVLRKIAEQLSNYLHKYK